MGYKVNQIFLSDELIRPMAKMKFPTGETQIVFKEGVGGGDGYHHNETFTVPEDGLYYVKCLRTTSYASDMYIQLPSGLQLYFANDPGSSFMCYLFAGQTYTFHMYSSRYQSIYGYCNFWVYQ